MVMQQQGKNNLSQQFYKMINSLRSQQKNKVCTVYHNYNISTKNFDGRLLYELFLQNLQFPKPEVRKYNRSESKKSSRASFKSQSHKNIQQDTPSQKQKKIFKLITTQYDRGRQTTQFTNSNVKPEEVNASRQCYSGQNFYDTLYKSMETRKIKNKEEKQKQPMFTNYNCLFNNKIKRIESRKKQKLKVQDFVKAQQIIADPWIEGKMGGFSAEFICVIGNSKRIYSYEGEIKRQIASLTKVMTCITSLYLAKKYELDVNTQQIKISRRAAMLNGTSAELETGDIINLIDLLHAMMLPSGNDAAQAISDYFDKFIQEKTKQQEKLQSPFQRANLHKNKNQKVQQTIGQSIFIKQMNNLAAHLNMKNTHFDNAHGLSNRNNYSTANDMAELCHYAMKNPEFRQIVRCKQYESKLFSSHQKMKRTLKWTNTNKLLALDYCQGIKTGITPTAGPCMAAYFQKQEFPVTIVILNAKNKSKRFQQVKNLYEWACKQINN